MNKKFIIIILLLSIIFLRCNTKSNNDNKVETVNQSIEDDVLETKTEKKDANVIKQVKAGDIDLKLRKVLGNRIEMLIPSSFVLMPKEMLDNKYPMKQHRPNEVYTNDNGTINVALNHTANNAAMSELPKYKQLFEKQFSSPSIKFISSEIKKIDNMDYIVMDFITPAIDNTSIYNLLFITSLDNRLLMGTFNCTIDYLNKWQKKGKKIVNSVKILK